MNKVSCNYCSHVGVCYYFKQVEAIILDSHEFLTLNVSKVYDSMAEICKSFERE